MAQWCNNEGRICLINLEGIWSNPDEEFFNDEIIIISFCSVTDSRTIDFAQKGPRNCFQDLELEEGTTPSAVVFPTSEKLKNPKENLILNIK